MHLSEWDKFHKSWLEAFGMIKATTEVNENHDDLNECSNDKEKNNRLLIVHYEDLKTRTEFEIGRILDFLSMPKSDENYSEEVFDKSVLPCVMERQKGSFRRKKKQLDFDIYDSEMKKHIEGVRDRIYRVLHNKSQSK